MKRKLDAARIEEARRSLTKSNTKEVERRQIQETISKNRRGERRVRVILPDKKLYAYQESRHIRVAAYCRVSTAEEAQMNSFEIAFTRGSFSMSLNTFLKYSQHLI